MSKARLQERCIRKMDYWPLPRAAPFSWTRSVSCRSTCRPSCCVRSRKKKSGRSAAKRIQINIRILAATNGELEEAVSKGTFRRDLYFRLNVLTLRIPPLRERRQDIPLLAAHFLERAARDSGQERVLSDEALKAMLAYDWPGNVRELDNCLERACALTTALTINVRDLPTTIYSVRIEDESGLGGAQAKIVPMSELEKQTILNTIVQVNGDKLLAARMLGIGKTTLYRKLKEYASQP